LSKCVLPNTIDSIGTNAFAINYVLSNINIPEGLTYIGRKAFDINNSDEDLPSYNAWDTWED
jgi:hypothetical protein